MDEKNPHKLKPFTEVRKIYEDAGIMEEEDMIVYCGTSREASLEYVILKRPFGYLNVPFGNAGFSILPSFMVLHCRAFITPDKAVFKNEFAYSYQFFTMFPNF